MNGAWVARTFEIGASGRLRLGEESSVGRESGRGVDPRAERVERRVETVEVVRSARIGRREWGAGEGDGGGLVLEGRGAVMWSGGAEVGRIGRPTGRDVGVPAAARTGSGMQDERAARKVLLNEWI